MEKQADSFEINRKWSGRILASEAEYRKLTGDCWDLLTGVAQPEKPCYVRSRTDAVYDLQGRRVQISSGQKGVYITAGRKIVVR